MIIKLHVEVKCMQIKGMEAIALKNKTGNNSCVSVCVCVCVCVCVSVCLCMCVFVCLCV